MKHDDDARLWRGLKRLLGRFAPDIKRAEADAPAEADRRQLLDENLLLNQINPHFLYNTLESIRGQAMADGNDQVADMIEALSSFFRYNVSSKSGIVTLAEELHNVEEYLKIQSFRFGDRFRVDTTVEPTIAANRLCLPKLTLQPIVENAIVHGLESREEQGTIRIRVLDGGALMLLNVSDDGVGMSEERLSALLTALHRVSASAKAEKSHSGIALNNINQRVKLFFGEDYGLSVYSMQGIGTTVELLIPKVEKDAKWTEGAPS